MVVSMTGFGRSKKESGSCSVIVEVKTVNHRFSEYHFRMPRQFLKMEDKLKKKLSNFIHRGRVEVFVTVEGEGLVHQKVKVDWDLLQKYVEAVTAIREKFQLKDNVSLHELLNRDDLIHIEEQEEDSPELNLLLLEAVEEAAKQLKKMRLIEGAHLEKDILLHLHTLEKGIETLKEFSPQVILQYEEKLRKKMNEFLDEMVDEARILSEVAIFSDKADINEELTRLLSHIKQFSNTLLLNEPIGRKMDFLLQEMNREVNTIGAKANHATIGNEVVEMKSLLEKMKEQVQNIE
ncbi:YicC/YloC family endoribonuclease [Bacillus sp. 03113]|uniref:YicC/YloC family endoribonuclease n=1 Tax=Bacillus sp. 03113 TaxID=2578211 RepID=UPI001144C609|nr:YicC/YloC family endoribonuclease [Bacillus sp. 03113]